MTANPSTRVPVYQVDFTAQGSGKHLSMTKKKVSFKFGYANGEALDNGAVGVECRGQEHEVVCVWSVTSGKRQIFVDGNPAHHSVTGNIKKRFILSFPFLNHHVMKLTIHAAPPVSSTKNGLPQRQYDLTLDGQSFFEFVRIFELGRGPANMAGSGNAIVQSSGSIASNGAAGYSNYTLNDQDHSKGLQMYSPGGVGSYDEHCGDGAATSPGFARSVAEQEAEDLKVAIEASLREEEEKKAALPPAQTPTDSVQCEDVDLLDLLSDEPSAPWVPLPINQTLIDTSVQQYCEPQSYLAQPDYAPQESVYSGYPAEDAYAPKMNAYANFQYQQSSFDIMSQYKNFVVPPPPQSQAPVPPEMAGMMVEDCTEIVTVQSEKVQQVKLSMAPDAAYLNDIDEHADEVAKATSMLCNLDSLKQESKVAMAQKEKAEQKKNATVVTSVDKNGKKVVKSKGLPPKSAMANGNLTMQEMQALKQQQQQAEAQRPVMQSYATTGQQTNAMVMYGQPMPTVNQYQQQGPTQQAPMPASGYANYAY